MKRGKRSACPFCIENYGTSTRSTVRFLRFVSDKEVQVSELEKSKRERKFKHLKELTSASAAGEVRGVRYPRLQNGKDQYFLLQEALPRAEIYKGKNTVVYRISGQLTYINGLAHKRYPRSLVSDWFG